MGRRKLAGIEISPLVGHSDEQVNRVTCSKRGEDLQRDEIGPASIVDPIRLIGHPAKPRSLLEARCLRRRTDFSHADNVCSKDQPLAVAQLLCFIRPAEERYRLFGGIPRVKLRLRHDAPHQPEAKLRRAAGLMTMMASASPLIFGSPRCRVQNPNIRALGLPSGHVLFQL